MSAVKEALKAQATKGAELYSLLFEPIEKYLENVKQLYIATEGAVSNVSFAGMKTNEGYLIDKYSICNVLSTKEICNSDGMKVVFLDKNKTAVLFGGADYSLLAEELATQENPLYALRGQGFEYLPGSKREVLNIADILSDKGWKHSIYTDEKATKVQFEMLSGRSPDVIHVSTHGYYFPPYERANGGIESDNSFKQSNDPMVRSGLLFSGANRAWGSFSKEDITTDNGVLTGYDISLMDLTGTELVVLSACNTVL